MTTWIAMLGIVAFAAGCMAGYWFGWHDGVGIGWTEAMREVRRIMARTKEGS